MDEVVKLQTEVKKYTEDEFRYKQKYKTQYEIMNKKVEDRQEEIINYQQNIKSKDGYIQAYAVENEFRHRQEKESQSLINKLQQANSSLQTRCNELQAKVDSLFLNRKSEAGMQLEIEHLKSDNERLLKMLKETEEFKDFGVLAAENSGGVRYVKPAKKNYASVKRSKLELEKMKDERYWVPGNVLH